jgi:hypothetical protein
VGRIVLSGCSSELPPTYGNLLRIGDAFTYATHRTLLPRQSLAREYDRTRISSFPAIGTTDSADPGTPYFSATHGPRYGELRTGTFADWRLLIEGRVARPGTYSLADLKRLPSRTQVTRQTCEEGWSAIAEWTGVPLRLVLEAAGVMPSARFVTFHAFDDIADNIDMVDALHPQTILAYGMNGRDLPGLHGAPLRLRGLRLSWATRASNISTASSSSTNSTISVSRGRCRTGGPGTQASSFRLSAFGFGAAAGSLSAPSQGR